MGISTQWAAQVTNEFRRPRGNNSAIMVQQTLVEMHVVKTSRNARDVEIGPSRNGILGQRKDNGRFISPPLVSNPGH